VEEELELLVVTLGLDLNDIMEVSLGISLEGNVHLYGQSSREWALHVVLDLELGGGGAGQLEPPDSLADIPDANRNLV